ATPSGTGPRALRVCARHKSVRCGQCGRKGLASVHAITLAQMGRPQSSEHLRQYRSVSVAASGFCGPPGFGPFSLVQAGICEAEAGFGLNQRLTDVIPDFWRLV